MIIWNSFNRGKTAIKGVFQYTRSIFSETPPPNLPEEGLIVRSKIEQNTLGRLSPFPENRPVGVLSVI